MQPLAVPLVPQPALPAVRRAGQGRLAAGAPGRGLARTLRAPGVHPAAQPERVVRRASALGDRHAVRLRRPDPHRVCRQPQMDGLRKGQARLQPGAAHLDPGVAGAPACACGHGLRGAGPGRQLEHARAQAELPVSRACALNGVSRQVYGGAARGAPGRAHRT